MDTTDTTTLTKTKLTRFLLAYWDWKRRNRTSEPTAEEFEIHPLQAEEIARHVHQEFERGVLSSLVGK